MATIGHKKMGKKTKDDVKTDGDDKKGFVLDEDKITREEFKRAMSFQEYPKEATKIERYDKDTTWGEDNVPEDQDDLTRGNADDAELGDEKIQLDAKDYAEFLNWKAGEKRLRNEERKMKVRALLKDKKRPDKVQTMLRDEEKRIHLKALKELERKGKLEDAEAFRRQLKIEEPDEEEIDPEDDVQVPEDEINDEGQCEDTFCSPEERNWISASQALPEERKRQIDARVAAWKKKIRDEVIAEIAARQIGKDGEVKNRAEGEAVGVADAEKNEDSMKTPVKPKNQGFARMLKIVEPEVSDEEMTPKMSRKSTFTDEEDEARRQYKESVANMKQATERIRRIKA